MHNVIHVKQDSALILIDMQKGFIGPNTTHTPKLVSRFLSEHAKDFNIVIATRFLNTSGSQFDRLIDWQGMMNPPDTDLVDGIEQYVDVVLNKRIYQNASAIAQQLDTQGIHNAYILGIDTDVCVLQNSARLFDLGYTPLVLFDLCATNAGDDVHQCMLKVLQRTIGARQVLRGVV